MMQKIQCVYIEHMGSCPGRALDARKFEYYFQANGFKIITNPKAAQYILFITCAYKQNIEDLAVLRIQKLARYQGRLIVGGCLKKINEEKLNRYFKGLSFSTSNSEYIDAIFPDFKIKFQDIPDSNIIYPENLLNKFMRVYKLGLNIQPSFSFFKRILIFLKEKSRLFRPFYIRVCSGCIDSHCTYCKIWRATGRLSSKPVMSCIKEFQTALSRGYRRIILVGENVGAYGLDIDLTFPDLLRGLIQIEGSYEIQIDCVHPMWLIKYKELLVSIFESKKIRIVNCPIQSGNSRILKLMNRAYDIHELKVTLDRLRYVFPEVKFYTHIIAGFPSETDEEFRDTIRLVKELKFYSVQMYPFSLNESLPLEYRAWEIPAPVIKSRLKKATDSFRKAGIVYLID